MGTTKPLLLIADDDPEILSMVARRLTKRGFQVIEASNGVDALKLAREHMPAAVVLDVMMPGKSGWEVARDLRADALLSDVGILMLTAIGEKVNEMTAPLYGADEFLDKPFEFADLDARIDRILYAKSARSK